MADRSVPPTIHVFSQPSVTESHLQYKRHDTSYEAEPLAPNFAASALKVATPFVRSTP